MRELTFVALGGAFGAVSRYWVSTWVQRLIPGQFPYGTLTVNVVGCFCLGLLMELLRSEVEIPPTLRHLVGVGFLGAFTTFSTFGHETIRCLERNVSSAVANVALNVVVGLFAVALGLFLGKLFGER